MSIYITTSTSFFSRRRDNKKRARRDGKTNITNQATANKVTTLGTITVIQQDDIARRDDEQLYDSETNNVKVIVL